MKLRPDLSSFLSTIPSNITLVMASKYIDSKQISEAYLNGISHFGENRVDSFLDKYQQLSSYPLHWHFIGHLQRNKAKQVINKIEYLHSLDSLQLAKVIEQYSEKPLKCFIEVSINLEENKNGVPYYEVSGFVKQILQYTHIELVGLMMMAKDHSSQEELHSQFSSLRELRDNLEKEMNIKIPYLSMGMSGDYLIAIEEKATHIRLGKILLTD